MAVTEQTALIGSFTDRRLADRFVEELRHAGFREDQYGIASLAEEHRHEVPVEEAATAGALTGLIPGAIAGAVATGLIPGVGPVIAGGLLAGTLGGAAAGASAGGVLGALVGLGISEDEARDSEGALKAGRTLVVVQGNGRLGEAAAILDRVVGHGSPGPVAAPHLDELDELSGQGP